MALIGLEFLKGIWPGGMVLVTAIWRSIETSLKLWALSVLSWVMIACTLDEVARTLGFYSVRALRLGSCIIFSMW